MGYRELSGSLTWSRQHDTLSSRPLNLSARAEARLALPPLIAPPLIASPLQLFRPRTSTLVPFVCSLARGVAPAVIRVPRLGDSVSAPRGFDACPSLCPPLFNRLSLLGFLTIYVHLASAWPALSDCHRSERLWARPLRPHQTKPSLTVSRWSCRPCASRQEVEDAINRIHVHTLFPHLRDRHAWIPHRLGITRRSKLLSLIPTVSQDPDVTDRWEECML